MDESIHHHPPQDDEGLFQARINRFCQAAGVNRRSDLGAILGLKASSLSTSLGRKVIPPHWYFILADQYDVSIDWLYSGRGTMKVGAGAEPMNLQDMITWVIETFKQLDASNEQIREAIMELLRNGTPKSE